MGLAFETFNSARGGSLLTELRGYTGMISFLKKKDILLLCRLSTLVIRWVCTYVSFRSQLHRLQLQQLIQVAMASYAGWRFNLTILKATMCLALFFLMLCVSRLLTNPNQFSPTVGSTCLSSEAPVRRAASSLACAGNRGEKVQDRQELSLLPLKTSSCPQKTSLARSNHRHGPHEKERK